jgi:hypothetical protein
MKIRPYRETDLPILATFFDRSGFEYDLPDPSSDEFIVNLVRVDESGVPRMAILTRVTAEMFMLADATWETPGVRLQAFAELHEQTRKAVAAAGISDVHAWLPPQIAKSFGRRLTKMFGWTESKWKCFWRSTR